MIKNAKFGLPDECTEKLSKLYSELSGIKFGDIQLNEIGNVKSGTNFSTDDDNIDSNTVSSGQDNLFIILRALVSLRFYFESLDRSNYSKESILLIDEFDATLHPCWQEKVFMATHSISLIEYAL